jgi:hypothetical protein
MKFLCTNHQIDMRQSLQERPAARLRHASEEPEDDVRTLFGHAAQHAHFPERLLISHVAHAACIQEHHVGLVLVRDALIASCDERVRNLFRVALIHLATVGLDEKFRHERAKTIHARLVFAKGVGDAKRPPDYALSIVDL